jgi:exopolysaccharide production protein ExoZ
MVGSVFLGLILKPEVPILALMSSALLIEFLCGILIAWAFTRDVVLNIKVCAALLTAAAALIAISLTLYTNGDLATWWRLPFFGLPAATLVAVVILRPGLQTPERTSGGLSRLFVTLGDSSYALYLTHIFTLRIVALLLHRILPPLPAAVDFALLLVLAVGVGHLFFLLVERPIYQFLKAHLLTEKPMDVPA